MVHSTAWWPVCRSTIAVLLKEDEIFRLPPETSQLTAFRLRVERRLVTLLPDNLLQIARWKLYSLEELLERARFLRIDLCLLFREPPPVILARCLPVPRPVNRPDSGIQRYRTFGNASGRRCQGYRE